MTLEYDPHADAFYMRIAAGEVYDTIEQEPGMMVDYDKSGQLLGVEILNFKRRLAEAEAASLAAPDPEAAPATAAA
jgi:uncharacterized protein YuzE